MKLNISLSTDQIEPGEECKLEIFTTPNSFVSLLGVDRSVHLLGNGNDIQIKETKVYTKDESYKSFDEYLATRTNVVKRLNSFFVMTNAAKNDKIDCNLETLVDSWDPDSVTNTFPTEEDHKKLRVRKFFEESWIFDDLEADDNGKFTFTKTVPDTITSFIISGFTISYENGLATAPPQTITVFKDFFIKLNLPYSIRFGEVLRIEVNVFNYIRDSDAPVEAKVLMLNPDDEFEFIKLSSVEGVCEVAALETNSQIKTITIKPRSASPTIFLIRALKTGNIKIKIRATTSSKGDEVEKLLLVEHEGLTHYRNVPKLFDLRRSENMRKIDHFDISIPDKNVIANSIKIEAKLIGDIVGPALINIDELT